MVPTWIIGVMGALPMLDKGGPVLGHLLREPFLPFGLNLLLWWLVVALSFVLRVAASLFGFFPHLSEFLPLFGR